jgi:hypothetical protein
VGLVEQEDAKKAKAGSEWDNTDATQGPVGGMSLPRPDMPLRMPLLSLPVEEIGGMKLLPLDGPLMLMPPLLEEEPLLVPPLQA